MSASKASHGRPQETLGFDYQTQAKDRITHCNLCGGQKFVVLTHYDRYGYPAEAQGCLECGLVFLNPVMTPEAYRDFYSSTYRNLVSNYHGRRIDAETIQSEQQVYAIERADFLAPFLAGQELTSLLDIGGSTGIVANYFARRFNLKATVLDPASSEIEHARRMGLETINALLEDYEPAGRCFELVILCQTIDHLLDVGGAMHKVRSLLSASGLFFFDIVDFRAAYLRNASVEEAVKIDHPYYLTESSMAAYLKRAGFEVLGIDYEADHLHIGYLCRAAKPEPEYLPPQESVSRLWREVRKVQSLTRSGG